MTEKYDLKPSKQAYQAVKSDVTPVSAFKELIDNALDNWRRVLDGLDPVSIEIEYHEGDEDTEEEIVIRDNSGGVEEEDLRILFALGQSKKDTIDGSIGAYGVGAKKAIVNLGDKATIRSRHLYADTGFGFTIDEDWLEDDTDWSVDKVQYDDIDEGVTEIRISDLNTPWDEYSENLTEDLSKTYQQFLAQDKLEELEQVSMTIRQFNADGEKTRATDIEPPDAVEWSFTPMDNLYARRYEGIPLDSREFDDRVILNVTVGLMQKSSAEDSGADIFCQNRKVLTGVTDKRAGFGTGSGSSRLGKFSGQHRRLRVIIEFETDGDAKILPWDAQKSDIDPYSRVSRAAYDWIRRIVKPYYTAAGAFNDVPTTLTRPYGRNCEHSVTEHLDNGYDYSDRERVVHKPDVDFPDAKMIGQRAAATAPLGVHSMGDLPEEFDPAYREELLRLLNDEYDVTLHEGETIPCETVPVTDVPADMEEDEATDMKESLSEKAATHAHETTPRREIGLETWKQAVYDVHLRRELYTRIEDQLETVEENLEEADIDFGLGVDWVNEDGDIVVDLDDLETFEPEEDSENQSESDSEGEFENDDGDGFRTDNGDESEADDSGGGETTPDDDSLLTDGEIESDNETGEQSGLSGGLISSDSEEGQSTIGMETATGSPSDGDSVTQRTLDLNDDEWETLVDALGLDEDATPEEVREQLLDTLSILRQLPTQAGTVE